MQLRRNMVQKGSLTRSNWGPGIYEGYCLSNNSRNAFSWTAVGQVAPNMFLIDILNVTKKTSR